MNTACLGSYELSIIYLVFFKRSSSTRIRDEPLLNSRSKRVKLNSLYLLLKYNVYCEYTTYIQSVEYKDTKETNKQSWAFSQEQRG